MKKFFARYKQEDGAVAIIMSFAMVVLLGFTAFAVDQGLYYHKKSQLQSAIDAAALAAVYKLPSQSEASATVLEYIQKNGFTADDVEIIFPLRPQTDYRQKREAAKSVFCEYSRCKTHGL
jgi:uncharacterized membrane protein